MDEPSEQMMADARQIRAYIEARMMRIHVAHVLLAAGYLDEDTLRVFKRGDWLKSITVVPSVQDN